MRKIAILATVIALSSPAFAQQDIRKTAAQQVVPPDSPASYLTADAPVAISNQLEMIVVTNTRDKQICYITYRTSWNYTQPLTSSCVSAK